MRFEYDPNKSASNKTKHSVDFEEAKELWEDPDLIEVRLAFEEEPRFAVIGRMRGACWTAIVTPRKDKTRIISVRRSHTDEERVYYENL